MFSIYFKIAWRNLLKSKVYSAINIFGLAIGMAVALLIGLWVWDELSFNRYHENYERLAQVMTNEINNGQVGTGGQVAIPLRAELQRKFASEFAHLSLASGNNPNIVAFNEKKVTINGIWAEPAFPEMLTLKMLDGSREALKDISSILIAKSLAITLFGRTDPLNRTVKINNEHQFKVAGIYEDLPQNTTFSSMKFLLPWSKFLSQEWVKEAETCWGCHSFWMYVQLSPGANLSGTNEKIKNVATSHSGKAFNEESFLHPMRKWHLYSEFKEGKNAGGRISLVWLFSIIGFFVLLLACINFMNLATARSEKRAKEVGVRKAIGSRRGQLVAQFLTESALVACCSMVIAVLLVLISLPWFNSFVGKQIGIPWSSLFFWSSLLAFTLLVSLVSGSYPAFYLSGFKTISVLKGKLQTGRVAIIPRKVLVVTQFTVSITLIIGTLIVYRQIQHAKSRPVGYSREGLLSVDINTNDLKKNYEVIRQELLQTGMIENTAESSSPLTDINSNNSGYKWKGKDPNASLSFGSVAVTHEYGSTAKWQIKEGRDYFAADSHAMILNEAAVALTGLKKPVGEIIRWNDDDYTIVGVVENMVMESPYKPIKPTIFFLNDEWTSYINIRLHPAVSPGEALAKITPIFKKYNPGGTFEYHFVDDEYAKKFSDEQRIGNLATLFALLTIFISCLGLFGLTSFTAEQRTKEIGIRKVLGATVLQLWKLLSKDFVILVLISCLTAIPISGYLFAQWLQGYAYRTEISWWIFAAAGLAAMGITLLTVSFQAIKAAAANPVKSLRAE